MSQAEQAKAELSAAQALLPGNTVESPYGYNKAGFQQALDAGTPDAAMDILACVIDDNPNPGQAFWQHMIRAAELLGSGNVELYRSLHDAG